MAGTMFDSAGIMPRLFLCPHWLQYKMDDSGNRSQSVALAPRGQRFRQQAEHAPTNENVDATVRPPRGATATRYDPRERLHIV